MSGFNFQPFSANVYLFKFNDKNTRKMCKTCSKLTIKTPEQRRIRSGVFFVNLENISYLFLVFLSLNLDKYMFAEFL